MVRNDVIPLVAPPQVHIKKTAFATEVLSSPYPQPPIVLVLRWKYKRAVATSFSKLPKYPKDQCGGSEAFFIRIRFPHLVWIQIRSWIRGSKFDGNFDKHPKHTFINYSIKMSNNASRKVGIRHQIRGKKVLILIRHMISGSFGSRCFTLYRLISSQLIPQRPCNIIGFVLGQ